MGIILFHSDLAWQSTWMSCLAFNVKGATKPKGSQTELTVDIVEDKHLNIEQWNMNFEQNTKRNSLMEKT